MKSTLFLFCLFITSPLFAQVIGYNEEFIISDDGNNPSITSLDEDKFVVCWDEFWADESMSGINGQIFGINGIKIGDDFSVNTYTDLSQINARITSLNENKFVVCWSSNGQDEEYSDGIFAQIFDGNGAKIGYEFQVNTYTKQNQRFPEIITINENKFIICWVSYDQDGSKDGIFAQIFDDSGGKIGDEFRINTYTTGWQNKQSISSLSGDMFVVSWVRSESEGEDYGIVAKTFDEDGNTVRTQFHVNTYKWGTQTSPSITAINEEKFVVCWSSGGQDGDGSGVFAQIFHNSGNKIGGEFQVNTHTENHQTSPKVTALNEKEFIVCWKSGYQSGPKEEICAQIFDSNGKKIGLEFKVISDATGSFLSGINVATLNEEKFVVYWGIPYGNEEGIFAKIYLNNPILHTLNSYELISPIYDATINAANPVFKWHSTSNQHFNFQWEVRYNLYISEDEGFANPKIINGITNTTYQMDTLAAGKTYFWKVLAKNINGDSLWSSNVNGFYIEDGATDIKKLDEDLVSKEFTVEQNYPNPFNPTTKIKYIIPVVDAYYASTTIVKLKVYDVLGKEIATLVNKKQQAGSYEVEFRTNNLSSGIYFYKLSAGNFSKTMKMVLMR